MLLYVVVVDVRGFGGLVLKSSSHSFGMSAILVVWVLLSGLLILILWPCTQATYGGSASVKVVSGLFLPSTTLRALSSATSL